jgi:hypothetical protein
MKAAPLVEFRSIPLHPTKHGSVSDRYPSVAHSFFDITITQGIAEIPSHAADDDLPTKVTPFEERGLVHVRSPVV